MSGTHYEHGPGCGLGNLTGEPCDACKRAYPVKKKRLTPAQNTALKAYLFAVRQQDRYLGSVFVTPLGQRDYEAKVKAAYNACTQLGLGREHGL